MNNSVVRQSVVYLQILSSQWVCEGKNVSNVIFGKVCILSVPGGKSWDSILIIC